MRLGLTGRYAASKSHTLVQCCTGQESKQRCTSRGNDNSLGSCWGIRKVQKKRGNIYEYREGNVSL